MVIILLYYNNLKKSIDPGTAEDVSKLCSALRGGKGIGSVRGKDVRKKQKRTTQATHTGINVVVRT